MKSYKNIDEYIGDCPPSVQANLRKLRKMVQELAPEATEKISYGMPSFNLNSRYLIYFGAFKNHISLFPASSATTTVFKKDLAGYEVAKGTIRFPVDKPLPWPLIRKIIRFRVKEYLERKK